MLGIDQSAIKVRVLSPFLGGGFGCKDTLAFSALAAASARELGRPVKLVLSRRQMYSLNGHRPSTIPDRDAGRRPARPADGDAPPERHLYIQGIRVYRAGRSPTTGRCANLQTGLDLARMNTGTPTPMRGPGDARPVRAESAMDELAAATGVDPIELRLRNYAERDPRTNNCQPWSSKHLREAMPGRQGIRLGEPAEGSGEPARGTLADRPAWRARHIRRRTSSDVLVRLDRRWPGRDRGRQP